MICPRCNTPNEANTEFCKSCGMDLAYTRLTENKASDKYLIIFISIAFFAAISQFAIRMLVGNWYEGSTKYIQGFLWLIQNLSFMLIPLAIKNQTLKIVGFVITAVMVIYWVYTTVEFLKN
ncbi:zinc-ribbon domain-containing protein [Flavobacterium qiangtangense]|uniref:Zinc-ribbon domain-containing protein n=1 Tax=Flavobacterium qiangtangense TaxID=1442595 RepID=A0ABW1PMY9_9FLAO